MCVPRSTVVKFFLFSVCLCEQQSTETALAAKDAVIGQLQRELQDLRAKLAVSTYTPSPPPPSPTEYILYSPQQEADNQLLQLSTSKAAELVSSHYDHY